MKRLAWIVSCVMGVGIGVVASEPAEPGARPQAPLHHRPGGMGDGGEWMMLMRPMAAKQLNLSSEQQAQIAAIASASSNEMSTLRTKMQSLARKQAELMGSDTIDEKAVLALTDEIGDVRSDMARAQVRQMLAVRKILTPEQRLKMREMMKRVMEPREGQGGKRREGRPAGTPKAGAPLPPPDAPAPPPPAAE